MNSRATMCERISTATVLHVPVAVSAKVGSFVPLKTNIYAERYSSSSALFATHHEGTVTSIQESIWVNKHRKCYLIPHIKRKTPARNSYHYNHSLPSPVCMHDETGFNYTCHFPQEPCFNECMIRTCAERWCLLVNLKLPFLTIWMWIFQVQPALS